MSIRSLFMLIGLFAVPAVADDPPADSITVITYNIRYANPADGEDFWTHRRDAVAKLVSTGDIIGLQEVTHSQLVDLEQRLDRFAHYGVGRDDGKQAGEYSPIFYRRDRFEAIDKGTFWLSDRPTVIGSRGWDAALPRVCSWMVLRDKRSDARVWIANTHFDHRGAEARAQSGRLIVEMASKRGNSDPVVVLGDFNCTNNSAPYSALTTAVDDTQLFDARGRSKTAPSGPDSTWNGFREIVPGRIIDHIFVTKNVTVREVGTLNPKTDAGRFASDHLPVRTSLQLPNAESP